MDLEAKLGPLLNVGLSLWPESFSRAENWVPLAPTSAFIAVGSATVCSIKCICRTRLPEGSCGNQSLLWCPLSNLLVSLSITDWPQSFVWKKFIFREWWVVHPLPRWLILKYGEEQEVHPTLENVEIHFAKTEHCRRRSSRCQNGKWEISYRHILWDPYRKSFGIFTLYFRGEAVLLNQRREIIIVTCNTHIAFHAVFLSFAAFRFLIVSRF